MKNINLLITIRPMEKRMGVWLTHIYTDQTSLKIGAVLTEARL